MFDVAATPEHMFLPYFKTLIRFEDNKNVTSIIKVVLRKAGWEELGWFHLVQNKFRFLAFVDIVTKFWAP